MSQYERTFEVEQLVTVKVTVRDESAFKRCIENHDDAGVPQPDVKGGEGWRNMFYDITDEEGVLQHFAYNCVRNGIGDADRLDGWGNLPRDTVTMDVVDAEPWGFREITP